MVFPSPPLINVGNFYASKNIFIDFINVHYVDVLMFHYSSNDDDTGNKYGNDGAAPTKNSDEKMLVGFLDPLPLINMGNINSSNAPIF